MSRVSVLCSVVLSASLSSTPAAADAVTDWNLIATQAVAQAATTTRPGPSGLIDIAIVQIAVHDAMQAYEGRWESYAGPIPTASGSPVAAVAAAAHDVLIGVGLTATSATETVDNLYQMYLASRGLSNDPGIDVGKQARQTDDYAI